MSTNANLPAGAFITSIDGARCTAIPKNSTSLAGNGSGFAAAVVPPQTTLQDTTSKDTSLTTTTTTITTGTTSTTTTATSTTSTTSTTTSQTTPTADSPAAQVLQTTTSTSDSAAVGSSTSDPTFLSTFLSTPVVVSSISPDPSTIAQAPASDTVAISTQASISSFQSTSTPIIESTYTSTTLYTSLTSQEKDQASYSSPTPPQPLAQTAASSILSISGLGNGILSTTTIPPSSSTAASPVGIIPENSSPPSQEKSSSKSKVGPVVGGVCGSIAFVGLICFLLWLLKRRKRNATFEPLSKERTRPFIEIDNDSLGPTRRSTKWKAEIEWHYNRQRERLKRSSSSLKAAVVGLGTSLKAKIERSRTPSVDMNRGNSQFIEPPTFTHSRTTSALSVEATQPTKERIAELWVSMRPNFNLGGLFRWRKSGPDGALSVATPSMIENRGISSRPLYFNHLVAMEEQERQMQQEHHRSTHSLGDLGLDLGNPFVDSVPRNMSTFPNSITHPEPAVSRSSVKTDQARRSRGLSVDVANIKRSSRAPSTAPGSRYPSMAPSEDSYRETMYSSFSTSARKGKGRSDPFDLERPELWRSAPAVVPNINRQPSARRHDLGESRSGHSDTPNIGNDIPIVQVGVHQPRVTSRGTYNSSKYSSGAPSFSDWGEPGPDLGLRLEGQTDSLRVYPNSVNSGSIYVAISEDIRTGGEGSWSANTLNSTTSNGVGKAM